ncbi:hypothetical protein FACS189475_04080 [Betaproteobacteria bacterium]|nr:hypothetical protein FACS189475_04080 [Betaproteobacteria bacterium]
MLFSNKLAVGIGLISYPLYLWHWPLLSYAHILQGGQNEIWTWRFIRLGCVLAAVILAFLTYKLVERPVRFGLRAKTAKVYVLIFLIAGVGGAGLYVWRTNGLPARYIDYAELMKPKKVQDEYVWERMNDIAKHRSFSDSAKSRVLILGDSMSADLVNMIADNHLLAEAEIRVRVMPAACQIYRGEEDPLKFLNETSKAACIK